MSLCFSLFFPFTNFYAVYKRTKEQRPGESDAFKAFKVFLLRHTPHITLQGSCPGHQPVGLLAKRAKAFYFMLGGEVKCISFFTFFTFFTLFTLCPLLESMAAKLADPVISKEPPRGTSRCEKKDLMSEIKI